MKVMKHFPYRTGYVRGTDVVEFPRIYMNDFEQELAKSAKVQIDNHTCYEVLNSAFPGNKTIFVMFTDSVIRIGTRIDKGDCYHEP